MARQKSLEYRQTKKFKELVAKGQEPGKILLYGPKELHTKICENKKCNKTFKWFGRKGVNDYKRARFCCVSCAHSRAEYWDKNASNYRTIAFKNWDKKCVICGFDKIVAVHHYDLNKKNNTPKNLIPLCPNHHEMIHHSSYSKEIIDMVDEWLKRN
jgi:hypothetical protein